MIVIDRCNVKAIRQRRMALCFIPVMSRYYMLSGAVIPMR